MKINSIDVQNFRKLRQCRIEFAEKKTIFVGANNSGKTSAMDALIIFLQKTKRNSISTRDFTLSNWNSIEALALDWVTKQEEKEINLDISLWQKHSPSVDVWLHVNPNEIHYVSHLIPTLSWKGGLLGVRISFEPEKIEELYKSYKQSIEAVAKVGSESGEGLRLWPQNMKDFLDRKLHSHFKFQAYILDPAKYAESKPQVLDVDSEPLTEDPFNGIFKIDVINAQRGFTDVNSDEQAGGNRKLSTQLKSYFDKHLNPTDLPDEKDISALEAIENARTEFDKKLKESFQLSISELEELNYPGFNNPDIIISSKINPLDGLNHDASIQFRVGENKDGSTMLSLPEQYNGLGYQNLISMIFRLIRYRDEWMRVGKIGKRIGVEEQRIEPLHLVLIEEPEAHLHAQVQQVFIKKAYSVLRNHDLLKASAKFATQLVVSTHSSHIAHEVAFENLRYFKREALPNSESVPCAKVVNLSTVFGTGDDTAKFVARYLKATHCDLFFADATVLVEGPAERILVPHFIKEKFPKLDKAFVTILEIGGSHAHKLRPLIEHLGLYTLIITDIDSVDKDDKKTIPKIGDSLSTGNDTIKSWVPAKTKLDDALKAKPEDKTLNNFIRVSYQYEMAIKFDGKDKKVIPYTFEDALAFSNIEFFKNQTTSTGLLKKMSVALQLKDHEKCAEEMFKALDSGKKAEMALDLIFMTDPKSLEIPLYISEGLQWLQSQISRNRSDIIQPTQKV